MGLANVNATCVQTTISVAHFMNFQPSLKEIRDTVTAFNLFIRDLGHVISIFPCQKAQISNNMTALATRFYFHLWFWEIVTIHGYI